MEHWYQFEWLNYLRTLAAVVVDDIPYVAHEAFDKTRNPSHFQLGTGLTESASFGFRLKGGGGGGFGSTNYLSAITSLGVC